MTNRKLRAALFLFFLLSQISTFSQTGTSKNLKVELGTPYEFVEAQNKQYFSDGKGFAISVKTDAEKVVIQRYDLNSTKEVSKKEYADFPPENKMQWVVMLGEKVFYIFSSFNKKTKGEDVYSREIDINEGTFAAHKLLFSTTRAATTVGYHEKMSQGIFGLGVPIRFEVHKSFDNARVLIRYRLAPIERDNEKNYDVLGFYVFDVSLEKQWGGEIKMPYTEKAMTPVEYGVGKDGRVHMMVLINESKQFELLSITSDLNVKADKIDIDANLMFAELQLHETVDGNLNCAGFYASGLDFYKAQTGILDPPSGAGTVSANTNGVVNFTMDTDGKILQKINVDFPIDLINQFESKDVQAANDKRESKGEAGIRGLKLIDVAIDADGNTTIVGEQQFVNSEAFNDGTRDRKLQEWFYCDIIIARFDKGGSLQWMKKLPKRQTGRQGKGSMSIKFVKGKNASYVFYLDDLKDMNQGLYEDGKIGYLTAFKIDDTTGAIEKHIGKGLGIDGAKTFQFRIARLFGVDDGMLFLVEIETKAKKNALVKIELVEN